MRNLIPIACFVIAFAFSNCTNDPKKNTQSNVDPELKDTVGKKTQKVGPKDATDGDTTSQYPK